MRLKQNQATLEYSAGSVSYVGTRKLLYLMLISFLSLHRTLKEYPE